MGEGSTSCLDESERNVVMVENHQSLFLYLVEMPERSPKKKDSPTGNRTKNEAMDALTSIAITAAVASSVTSK